MTTHYTENQNRKVFCIDFDHTLTADPKGTYSCDPEPEWNMIKAVRRLYRQGHIIIIWTARMWSDSPKLVSWLIKYQVPFHGVLCQKGGSSHYVDDKMMAIDEFLKGEYHA